MSNRTAPSHVAAAGLAVALIAAGKPASAQSTGCCTGYDLATVCASANLTKSRWCIQSTVPTAQSALPQSFCTYGDQFVTTLEQLFGVKAPDIFEIDLDTATGGAHTGTACSNFGDGVGYDSFQANGGNLGGVNFFYGWVLPLHEAVNVWTGMVASGWPVEFWADHVSGFPAEMDKRITGTIGMQTNNADLIATSNYFANNPYPFSGAPAGPALMMWDSIYMLPTFNGYPGFARTFGLVQKDGITAWDSVATNGANPDARRSEYVAAFLSLGAGQSILPIMQRNNICNGTQDGYPPPGQTGTPDPPINCTEAHVDAIANAHCALQAKGKPAADLSAFMSGNYAMVNAGPCGSTCPAECGCQMSTMNCVAPWVAGNGGPSADGGGGGSSGGPDGSVGADVGSTSGSDASSTSSGSSGSSSGASSGTGSSSSGTSSGSSSGSGSGSSGSGSTSSGSTSGTSSGSGASSTSSGTSGASGGSASGSSTSGSGSGSSGSSASSGIGSSGSSTGSGTGQSSSSGSSSGAGGAPGSNDQTSGGCGCRTIASAPGGSPMALRVLAAFFALVVARRRLQRRTAQR